MEHIREENMAPSPEPGDAIARPRQGVAGVGCLPTEAGSSWDENGQPNVISIKIGAVPAKAFAHVPRCDQRRFETRASPVNRPKVRLSRHANHAVRAASTLCAIALCAASKKPHVTQTSTLRY